jgi:hypothetical protein
MKKMLFFLVACCLVTIVAGADAVEKPNVVIILADDLGYSETLFSQGKIGTRMRAHAP